MIRGSRTASWRWVVAAMIRSLQTTRAAAISLVMCRRDHLQGLGTQSRIKRRPLRGKPCAVSFRWHKLRGLFKQGPQIQAVHVSGIYSSVCKQGKERKGKERKGKERKGKYTHTHTYTQRGGKSAFLEMFLSLTRICKAKREEEVVVVVFISLPYISCIFLSRFFVRIVRFVWQGEGEVESDKVPPL